MGWAISPKALWRTIDGGKSWKPVLSLGEFVQIAQTSFFGADSAVVMSDQLVGDRYIVTIKVTSNGGKNWVTKTVPLPRSIGTSVPMPRSIDMLSATEMYALVGAGGGMNSPNGWLLRTDDSGRTWSTVATASTDSGAAHPSLPSAIGSVEISIRGNGWLLARSTSTASSSLYYTTNGGRRWTQSNLSTSSGAIEMEPLLLPELIPSLHEWRIIASPSAAITSGTTSVIFVSAESSSTRWRRIGTCRTVLSSEGNLLLPTFVNAFKGWELVGTQLKTTSDGGSSWEDIPSDSVKVRLSSNALLAFQFTDSTHGWVLIRTPSNASVLLTSTDGGRSWNTPL